MQVALRLSDAPGSGLPELRHRRLGGSRVDEWSFAQGRQRRPLHGVPTRQPVPVGGRRVRRTSRRGTRAPCCTSRTADRTDADPTLRRTLPVMKALRRGLIVAVIAVLVGGFVKLRGKGGVPPTSGGWRELDGPDFR